MTIEKVRCVPGCGRWLVELEAGTLNVVRMRRAVKMWEHRSTSLGVNVIDALTGRTGRPEGAVVPEAPGSRPPDRLHVVCDCTQRWMITLNYNVSR